MNRKLILTCFALVFASCSAGPVPDQERTTSITPIHGSSLEGVEIDSSGSSTVLRVKRLPESGLYLQADFDSRFDVVSEDISGDRGIVHLVVDTEQGAQIGIAPTPAYRGAEIVLSFELGLPREVSTPPVGSRNVVTDLAVSDNGDATVDLSWTEMNNGDYDFNGQVNISDLSPLGQYMDRSYDRAAEGAELLTEYWVDGDGNGVINISDVTPIGANLGATIAGYNVSHNNLLLVGPSDGEPTVPRSISNKRDGLPPTYSASFAGLVSDKWVVTAVDPEGNEGADSDGGIGPVNLFSNVTVSGVQLFDLDGTNPGDFADGKITSRIIDPIEIVDNLEIGDTAPLPDLGAFASSGLPRNKVVFVQFRYLPTIELATGAPRGGSSLRGGSAVDDADYVTTSVPVRIPDGDAPVQMEASIDLSTANPDGGVFLDLTVTTVTPDPLGGPDLVNTQHIRLDPANASVSVDTDLNDNFDDEPSLSDSDGDCVSDARREQELDDDDYDDDDDERDEIEIEAVISEDGIDFATGLLKLEQIVVEDGDVVFEGGTGSIHFSELTRFEEKIKLDGDDIEQDIDPQSLAAGDTVEIDLYQLRDGSGELLPAFWAEKVDRRIDDAD